MAKYLFAVGIFTFGFALGYITRIRYTNRIIQKKIDELDNKMKKHSC